MSQFSDDAAARLAQAIRSEGHNFPGQDLERVKPYQALIQSNTLLPVYSSDGFLDSQEDVQSFDLDEFQLSGVAPARPVSQPSNLPCQSAPAICLAIDWRMHMSHPYESDMFTNGSIYKFFVRECHINLNANFSSIEKHKEESTQESKQFSIETNALSRVIAMSILHNTRHSQLAAVDLIHRLISLGADPNIPFVHKCQILDAQSSNSQRAVYRLLVPSDDSRESQRLASGVAGRQVVESDPNLIEKKFSHLNACDKHSLLQVAFEFSQSDIARALFENGAHFLSNGGDIFPLVHAMGHSNSQHTLREVIGLFNTFQSQLKREDWYRAGSTTPLHELVYLAPDISSAEYQDLVAQLVYGLGISMDDLGASECTASDLANRLSIYSVQHRPWFNASKSMSRGRLYPIFVEKAKQESKRLTSAASFAGLKLVHNGKFPSDVQQKIFSHSFSDPTYDQTQRAVRRAKSASERSTMSVSPVSDFREILSKVNPMIGRMRDAVQKEAPEYYDSVHIISDLLLFAFSTVLKLSAHDWRFVFLAVKNLNVACGPLLLHVEYSFIHYKLKAIVKKITEQIGIFVSKSESIFNSESYNSAAKNHAMLELLQNIGLALNFPHPNYYDFLGITAAREMKEIVKTLINQA